MQRMSDLWILICGFIIAVVNAQQDCSSGSYYDSLNANEATFLTDHWYLNTELGCTCSGRVDQYKVGHYSLAQNGGQQYGVHVAIWRPVGGDTYELDSSSITYVTTSSERRKKRSNIDDTVEAMPSSPLYVRKGAIIGVYFDDSTTNNLPVLGSINGYTLCTGASANVSGITTINCSIQSTEGTNRIIHAEAQIERILCNQGDIPSVISHGWSSLPDGDTEYMARVQYTCDTGYEITNGDEYLYCNENGQWSGTVPTCTVISCTPVAISLANGAVITYSNGYGFYNYLSMVMFSCINGYQLNGDSSITCQANGEWSGVPPTQCAPPEAPTTGAKSSTVNSLMPSVSTALLSSSTAVVATSTTQSSTFVQVGGVTTTPIHNSIGTTVLGVVSSSTLAASISSNSASRFILTDSIIPPTATSLAPSAAKYLTSSSIINPRTKLPGSKSHKQEPRTTQRNASPSQTKTATSDISSGGIGTSLGIAVGVLAVVIAGLIIAIVVLLLVYKKRSKTRLQFSRHIIGNNDGTMNSTSEGLINSSYDVVNGNINQQHVVPAINTLSNPQYTGNIPIVTYEIVDGHRFNMSRNTTYFELEDKQSPPLPPANSISLPQSDELSYFELEDGVFTEEPIYWEPASNTLTLYDQLAMKKYREIPRENIIVTDHLGSGQFGSVEKGTWRSQNGLVEVAIKTLKGVASDEDELKFLQEAAINGQFHHPNVVQLCGVVTVGQPTLIVLEYVPNGNLKEYLEKNRPAILPGGVADSANDQLASLLIMFSYQIASGMLYLSNKRFIHRDLAARNILVGNNSVCKIADFGMSRDLQDESYYRSNSKRIPVKWTAPEALNFRKYTTQSDVWSYGALLYEIWSVGYRPFEQYNNQECIRLVDSGYRLSSPPGCPRTVYSMMIDCWNPLATERPSFQYLMSTFQSAMVNGIYEEAMQLKTALGSPIDDNRSPYPDLQNKYI